MKATVLFLIAVFSFTSCSQRFSDSTEGLAISARFNKKQDEVFLPTKPDQLELSPGLEKKGLDLINSGAVPGLTGMDTDWFSNGKDFSVSVWVKSSSSTSDTTIILSNADFRVMPMGIYGNRRINKGITLYSYSGGWGWNMGNGSLHCNYEPVAEKQPIADNRWHQLAFTYNHESNEVRLYYDGINIVVLHVGDLRNENFKSEFPLRIGGDKEISPPYTSFRGTLDEFKVWTQTISPDIIRKEFEFYSKKRIVEPEMEEDVFTVVNWNIWHGGTHFTEEIDGFDGIDRTIELIEDAGADIVLMQETYGAGSRISSSLGFYYYEACSTIGAVWGANLSVMSRFPLKDVYMLEEPANYGKNYAFNNGGAEIQLSASKSVFAFSNWYNGQKPEDLDGALKAWDDLIQNADNLPIVYGGDFNSRSHLDDGEGKSGHSKLMAEAGFTDSYRSKYTDVENYPGFSNGGYSSRIDYIYFKSEKLEVIEVKPIVPNFKGRSENTPGYPSDHLGIVARFKIK